MIDVQSNFRVVAEIKTAKLTRKAGNESRNNSFVSFFFA